MKRPAPRSTLFPYTTLFRSDHDGRPAERPAHHVAWDPLMAEKGGYKHFMQKEIFEQPRAVRDTLLGRISQDTDRKSTRLNSSHSSISYAVFCLKKKNK